MKDFKDVKDMSWKEVFNRSADNIRREKKNIEVSFISLLFGMMFGFYWIWDSVVPIDTFHILGGWIVAGSFMYTTISFCKFSAESFIFWMERRIN